MYSTHFEKLFCSTGSREQRTICRHAWKSRKRGSQESSKSITEQIEPFSMGRFEQEYAMESEKTSLVASKLVHDKILKAFCLINTLAFFRAWLTFWNLLLCLWWTK